MVNQWYWLSCLTITMWQCSQIQTGSSPSISTFERVKKSHQPEQQDGKKLINNNISSNGGWFTINDPQMILSHEIPEVFHIKIWEVLYICKGMKSAQRRKTPPGTKEKQSYEALAVSPLFGGVTGFFANQDMADQDWSQKRPQRVLPTQSECPALGLLSSCCTKATSGLRPS